MKILCRLFGHKWKLIELSGVKIEGWPYGGLLIEKWCCEWCEQIKGYK